MSIFLFLTAASCVLLNEKMGFSNFWIGIFSVTLIVVTSHDAFVDCGLFNLPFLVVCYEHPFVKFYALSVYVRNTLLVSMYVCTWIVLWVVCGCFHVLCHDLRVEIFGLLLLVVILIENE